MWCFDCLFIYLLFFPLVCLLCLLLSMFPFPSCSLFVCSPFYLFAVFAVLFMHHFLPASFFYLSVIPVYFGCNKSKFAYLVLNADVVIVVAARVVTLFCFFLPYFVLSEWFVFLSMPICYFLFCVCCCCYCFCFSCRNIHNLE